jgi:hypothetical protein
MSYSKFRSVVVGFEIHIDNRVVYASLDEGLLSVILSHVDRTFFSVTGTKKYSFERIIWFWEDINDVKKIVIKIVDVEENSAFCIKLKDRNEYNPIKIGDKFEIKFTETDASSAPAKVTEDKNVKRPKTKLDCFRELESELKKQGLI